VLFIYIENIVSLEMFQLCDFAKSAVTLVSYTLVSLDASHAPLLVASNAADWRRRTSELERR